jgi:hypothetical protein
MAAKGATTCNGTGTVIAYALGANLERSDNAALTTDADLVNTQFFGTGAICSATGGTELCYDIAN